MMLTYDPDQDNIYLSIETMEVPDCCARETYRLDSSLVRGIGGASRPTPTP